MNTARSYFDKGGNVSANVQQGLHFDGCFMFAK